MSPSPSMLSEGRDEPERQLDEEQERRIRLQLYVFVVRCIAYPFNAKQPTDMARRQQKVSCLQDPAFPTSTSSSLGFSPGRTLGPLPAVLLQETVFLLLLEGKGIFGVVCVCVSRGTVLQPAGYRAAADSPSPPRLAEAVSLASMGPIPARRCGCCTRRARPRPDPDATPINFNFKTAVVHSCPLSSARAGLYPGSG